ncbi:MAG: hypothetical protein AAF732_07475 [Pseudomonadota bacterium]
MTAHVSAVYTLAALLIGGAFAAASPVGAKDEKATKSSQTIATSGTAKTKAAAKKVPACKGLERSACTRKTTCGWIVPKKAKDIRGRPLTAYCRTRRVAAKVAKPKPRKAAATPITKTQKRK